MKSSYSDRRTAIVGNIAQDKLALENAFDTLKRSVRGRFDTVKSRIDSARETVDVRYQIAQRPYAWVGGGFGLGLVLGLRHWILYRARRAGL